MGDARAGERGVRGVAEKTQVKQLAGILRAGVCIPAEPWVPVTEEKDVSLADRFKGLSEEIERKRREPDQAIALGEAVALLAHLRLRHTVDLDGDKVSVRGPALDEQMVARCKALREPLVRLLLLEAGRT